MGDGGRDLGGGGGLAVGSLGHGAGFAAGARAVLRVDVDGVALLALRLVVEVVEASGVALVPDGGAVEGKGAVAADGEAGFL